MLHLRKSRFRPLYKQFISLNENIQNRDKILQFKKQKWSKLVSLIKHKDKRYKKFKPLNQTGYIVSRYPNKWSSYKKGYYRTIMMAYKKFKLFYGNLGEKKVKNFIKQSFSNMTTKCNLYLIFIKLLETRLDNILLRAKFCESVRASRQLIAHRKVLVNNKVAQSQSIILQPGDLITFVSDAIPFIERSIANSMIWPIPPKHLVINYRTLQIIVLKIENSNLASSFNYNFNLEKLLIDFYNIK
jgi:ribosomal protein S4|uniref:Ribosomal protein S4 n=1 Tax=Didymosphenia geminata TaxID=1115533 RepID=A0A1L4BMD0_9STRA|nr:ribosomal protein S4 [Didymosphenia geminata]API83112.1 ribosomal protein S4 [Didymosphenia geminata]